MLGRQKPIHSINDALEILDLELPMKVDWEAFYSEGKRKAPFLENRPDENLVGYFKNGNVSPGRSLDLGCGIGRNAVFLTKAGCLVDAFDASATAITKARILASQERLSINFEVGSVLRLPIAEGEFGLVYDSGLLHHLQPHWRPFYLEKVWKSLKPEGRFGLACFCPEAAPSPEDWEMYSTKKMPPGVGYSEERLHAILTPFFDILEFRRMKAQTPESGLFGMPDMWAALMKRKAAYSCA